MLVGKSSGVKKKTAPNMPDAPTIPSMADTTDSVCSTELSEEKKKSGRARNYNQLPRSHIGSVSEEDEREEEEQTSSVSKEEEQTSIVSKEEQISSVS